MYESLVGVAEEKKGSTDAAGVERTTELGRVKGLFGGGVQVPAEVEAESPSLRLRLNIASLSKTSPDWTNFGHNCKVVERAGRCSLDSPC